MIMVRLAHRVLASVDVAMATASVNTDAVIVHLLLMSFHSTNVVCGRFL